MGKNEKMEKLSDFAWSISFSIANLIEKIDNKEELEVTTESFYSTLNEEVEEPKNREKLLKLLKKTLEELEKGETLRRSEKSGRKNDAKSGGDTDEESTKGQQIIIEALNKHKTKKEQMKELITAGIEKDEILQATGGSERTYNKALKET